MLMHNIKLMVLCCLVVLVCTSPLLAKTSSWKAIHGEVIQVFAEQHKLLLRTNDQKKILTLTEDCQILRTGSSVTLASLRPVAPDAFQDVLCWLDHRGQVSVILVNYCVQEQDGVLISYDIFGNLK
ncbi:MAG: hypothetical protein GX971_01990 [Firmicutes bacterium]|nr:hypothetical protein [Bacillota bacterium]